MKRLELLAKKAAKTPKQVVETATEKKKPAVEKPKKDDDAPFVNTTPKGHKKGIAVHSIFTCIDTLIHDFLLLTRYE